MGFMVPMRDCEIVEASPEPVSELQDYGGNGNLAGTTPGRLERKILIDEVFVNIGFEVALAPQANYLLDNIPALEYQESGNGPNPILRRQSLLLIDIDFAKFGPPVVIAGEFIDYGTDHLARSTPLGPKINQHRHRCVEYFVGKICLGQNHDIGCSHTFDYRFLLKLSRALTSVSSIRRA